jgi:hypothetical protein
MSELFDKVDAYLEKFNIELTDKDKYLDFRLGIDEFNEIYKWDFPVPKPTDEDLKDITNDEEQKDKKNLKKIIKDLRANQITILKKKEFEKMKEKNLFETGDMFIYNAKLYIITNDNPLQSFPNVI